MAIQDVISDAELFDFLMRHRRIEFIPAGVQGGLFGADVEMVRLVVGKLGVLVSVNQLAHAREALRCSGVELEVQASLIAGADWIPV